MILFKFILQQVHHGSEKNAIFFSVSFAPGVGWCEEEAWADEGHVIFVFLLWKAMPYGKG